MSQHPRSTFVVTDPTEILRALVGLKDVWVLAYDAEDRDVELMIEQVVDVVRCPACGGDGPGQRAPGRRYVDLPVYGTPMRLAWKKHRMRCPNPSLRQEDLGALATTGSRPRPACSRRGPPSGRRSRSVTGGPSRRWQASSPVTGTPSTTPSPPTARPSWWRTASGSTRRRPSVSTRPPSSGWASTPHRLRHHGGRRREPPDHRHPAHPQLRRRGALDGQTAQGLEGADPLRCPRHVRHLRRGLHRHVAQGRTRSSTPFTSSPWPIAASTRCAVESRPSRPATAGGRTTRSIAPGASCSWARRSSTREPPSACGHSSSWAIRAPRWPSPIG